MVLPRDAPTLPDAPARARLVLSIDDDAVQRRFVEKVLTPRLQVVGASDGAAARKLLRLSRPDLVLLDLELPDVWGHDLLAELRAEPRLAGVPVLVLSSHHTADHAARSFALGAQGIVAKPVTELDLRRRVREVLRMDPWT